ncbi:MAG: MFS transporter [Anaerolineae bacterium]|nr:MFS transporter [Anaerolineae bacterium]
MLEAFLSGLGRALNFLKRQKRNYRVAVVRSAANSFLANLTGQYSSIYTVGLGADSVELGTIGSIGGAVSAFLSTPIGWLVDRFGIKPFYIIGVFLLAGEALLYALAKDWHILIAAAILSSIAMRLNGTACSVVCADSVKNRDRVTAQNLCVTFASLTSMISPLLAASLVTLFGGMNVQGIRPLYYLRFAGYGFVLVFLFTQLEEIHHHHQARGEGPGFVASFQELFAGRSYLPKWIVVAVLSSLPSAMTTSFFQLFAYEIKGADQYLLGAMTTATVVARLLFGLPLGRLADRIGRKKVIYILTPLWYASFGLLILSTAPWMLVVAAAFQVFYSISLGIVGAMSIELVNVEQQGRWSGLLNLFRSIVTVPAPFIGGLIWRDLGPIYVFLIPLVIDLVIKLPLLASVSESLQPEATS